MDAGYRFQIGARVRNVQTGEVAESRSFAVGKRSAEIRRAADPTRKGHLGGYSHRTSGIRDRFPNRKDSRPIMRSSVEHEELSGT